MVTTVTRESESNTAATIPAVEQVDVSAVPETPAELIQQWSAPERKSLGDHINAALAMVLTAITGPGMTDLQRHEREVAQAQGYIRAVTKM